MASDLLLESDITSGVLHLHTVKPIDRDTLLENSRGVKLLVTVEEHVLAGGPVERDKGFIIHDSKNRWESSIAVTPDITICTSRTILQDIATGSGPDNYLVALGCAGWGAGQLEKEISENAWLTAPANSELIFSKDYASKVNDAAALLGIDIQQISPEAGHS